MLAKMPPYNVSYLLCEVLVVDCITGIIDLDSRLERHALQTASRYGDRGDWGRDVSGGPTSKPYRHQAHFVCGQNDLRPQHNYHNRTS